jgi:hypothetical protein
MSTTPRTDALVMSWEPYWVSPRSHYRVAPQEWYDFARTLERELSAMTKERDELRRHADALAEVLSKVQAILEDEGYTWSVNEQALAAYRASQTKP